MFLAFIQYYKKKIPKIKGFLFKLLYSAPNLKVGSNFQCETFPSILIDKKAKISIGDHVIFKKDVEIRSHNNSHIQIKNGVKVDRGTRVLSANKSKIEIGEKSKIGPYTVFNGGDSIKIGKYCLISGFVYFQTSIHNHKTGKNIQDQGYTHQPVTLEDDVWIGAHTMVLPGSTIKSSAIVGANSVVNRNVKRNSLSLGVPITYIKERTE